MKKLLYKFLLKMYIKKERKWIMFHSNWNNHLINYKQKLEIVYFEAWYDSWIGNYWDEKNQVLYVCFWPTKCFRISKRKDND